MINNSIIDQINEILLQRLQKAGCTTGRLTCETPGTALIITLYGYKSGEEKPIYFWEWEQSFNRLAGNYMESFQPELSAFSVEINVAKDECRYNNTTVFTYKKQQQANAKQQAQEAQEKKEAYKKQLAAQTQPYGIALAQSVAAQLLTGAQLGYSHRDYCGTGLQYCNNQFEYVELWDYGVDVIQTFATEKEFAQWLSQQSDASLAMLDAASSFYWGNQTITRNRLEAFVNGKGDV